MENVSPKRWAILPLVFTCAAVGLMMAEEAAAQSNSPTSWWPFGQSNSGNTKVIVQANTPQPSAEDDPTSLKSKHDASPELYVSVARMFVESGRFKEAEDQYQEGLKKFPDDVRIVLGYAILKDQMKQPAEALKLYQQAVSKHPKQASVYNNLAVHYIQCGMIEDAIEAERRAVDLQPHEPRYRNNLAALLVEKGSTQEAFKQLREIYDEPVAHYDLGFLLNKRGLKPAALQEFTIALTLNPGMSLARQWVDRLSREGNEAGPPPVAPSPPQLTAPPPYAGSPQYVAPPRYPAQGPGPMQAQSPLQAPAAPFQYSAAPPQYTGGPQYQNPAIGSSTATGPAPLMAARDPLASGVRTAPPPAGNGDAIHRLPPVNDPGDPAEWYRPGQGPDSVAPDPPGWRR